MKMRTEEETLAWLEGWEDGWECERHEAVAYLKRQWPDAAVEIMKGFHVQSALRHRERLRGFLYSEK